MKSYSYYEPLYENGTLIDNQLIEITEYDIIEVYWDFWYNKMISKYGEGHDIITRDNCLKDWCVIHGAWISKNDDPF